MKIIIGLGNPGEKYKNTRHNVGFIILDALAKEKNLNWKTNKKFNAEIAKDGELLLAKPLTFMNKSGQTVQAILSYYNLLPKKLGFLKTKDSDLSKILTVIHDDLDIKFGKYKITAESGSAGHNGVANIINYLKTKKFQRFRIGIKNEISEKAKAEKFVLQNFSKEELVNIDQISQEIISSI